MSVPVAFANRGEESETEPAESEKRDGSEMLTEKVGSVASAVRIEPKLMSKLSAESWRAPLARS